MLFFSATLFWNSPGHLLHKTNPELSYFELSYVFWEDNDSIGRGTTVVRSVNLMLYIVIRGGNKVSTMSISLSEIDVPNPHEEKK